jgi:CubicO group peptidase (beta-lactamase class C family)
MTAVGVRVFRQTSTLFVVAIAAAIVAAIPTVRGQGVPELTPEARQKLDALIGAERERLKIPGLGVAIALNGRLTYVKSSGFADLENRLAVDDESRFRTASLAKPITATAVMQLVERGAIDLDAPIQRYCPAFPEKPWPVTPRQLLGHLAGVRHYARPGESTGTQHYFTIEDSLALFKKDPLLHEPGTKYEYSTFGFSVLGCAIEGASKMPLAAYLQANVFDKAGMTHTAIDDVYQIVPKRVRGYLLLTAADMKQLPPAAQAIARPDTVYNTALHDTSMKLPSGGYVSTPSDYVRFVLALLDHTLVNQSTLDAMWTSQKTRDGADTGYGFGFGVQMRKDGKNVSHSGNQAGAASLTRISPERRAALAIMTNLEDAPLGQLANQIGAIVLGPSR